MRAPVGLILAGGNGTRMGGVAKAELRLGETDLLGHVQARLGPQVEAMAVSTNTPLLTDLVCLPDPGEPGRGPLAGILAGLIWAQQKGATHVVSAAVDTPFFPCDLVPQLLLAAEGHPRGLAVAATPDGTHGTFGLWPVDLLDDLGDFLETGGRKVRAWLQDHNAAIAQFSDTTPPAFFNINTRQDLAMAQAWL